MRGYTANVLGTDIIDHEKPVGSPPRAIGGGLFVDYGDREGVTLHLAAENENDAERRIIRELGDGVTIDDLQETYGSVRDRKDEEQYAIASADVVAPLTTSEATFVADSLETLAGLDEGEHTDRDELLRVAKVFRDLVAEEEAE